MAALTRAVSRLVPERLERPLRSASFRRLALGKGISYLGDWLMVAVLVGWMGVAPGHAISTGVFGLAGAGGFAYVSIKCWRYPDGAEPG